MDFPPDFQKMCQVDTRKLLFLITTTASLIFILQFFSIPYATGFLSIFPSRNVFLIDKNNHSAIHYSPNHALLYSTTLNNSSSNTSYGIPVVVKNTDELDLKEKLNHTDIADGQKDSDEDAEHGYDYSAADDTDPNINSRTENVRSWYNNSISEKAGEYAQEPISGQPLSERLKKDDAFSSDLLQSEDIGSTTVHHLPALSPAASSSNITLPAILDANLSSTVMSGNSNVSSTRDTSNVLSEDKSDEKVQTDQTLSENTPSMISTSTQNGMPPRVMSISEMNLLLLERQTSSHSMIPRWSSVRDQEILSAKSQIENPPIVKKELWLYPPLFRNVSTFKRSYELMEQTLKVYVYREGARPVFHEPETKGIYASEGWFMKQIEANKQFSVKDPEKAHLFYLPFSTRKLEEHLYVPNSHSHKNLIAYLKDYLDLISAKYPFWNRTGGADHFLVACHDWAPSETIQHMSGCIRALCNADISEGFAMGKDVSLPETMVRLPRNPVKGLGGKAPSKRQILAFFAGGMHGYVRPILLKHWEDKDSDMIITSHMGRGKKSKANYIQNMKNSKYCICAKGYEVNSPRVVEAIFYECVPVIISDNFVPPFFEVLNWEAFAVFIPEKDIPNLKNILLSIPQEKYLKLQMRVRRVQQHFLWHPKPVKYDIFHMILHSVWYNRVFQIRV